MKRFAIAAAALALGLAACEEPSTFEPHTTVAISPFMGLPVLGDPAAPVTLVEYASTTCGHCKAFHAEVFPELKARYIDTGKVKLQFMMMPTQPVGLALAGESIARCAGEDKYFDVIDKLFEKQDVLFEAGRKPRKLQQELRAIGAEVGLDKDEVGTCMDSEAIVELVHAGVNAAPQEITGTPSFAISGVKLELETFGDLWNALDTAVSTAATPAGPTAVPAPQ
jgi:protein-disulfide isomerase